MSVQAVAWAMDDAPMMTTASGKPDTTARHVLQVLAERADTKGRDAFPSALDIEYRTGYDRRTIQRALKRLEAAALIVRDGQRYGQPNYHLDMSKRRPKGDRQALYDAYEKDRLSAAERKRLSRSRASGGDEDVGVTDSEYVSHAFEVRDVTHSASGRHALNAAHNHPGTTHQPSTTGAGDGSIPSGSQGTAAHPSLRSGRLPSEPEAERHRAEDPLPVVRTATIPGRPVASVAVRTASELDTLIRHHVQGCGYCQKLPTVCNTHADLIIERHSL